MLMNTDHATAYHQILQIWITGNGIENLLPYPLYWTNA